MVDNVGAAARSQMPPDQWWKEDADKTVVDPQHGAKGNGVSPQGEIIKSTQIVSMVGNEPILAGDLLRGSTRP